MSLPEHISQLIHHHYQAFEWGLITLDSNNRIIQINSKIIKDLNIQDQQLEIAEILPLLATESLDESFIIPFYNHGDQAFDIHFIAEPERKYLIMVPVDIMYEKVKYKQQLAHNQELEKMRFKLLFETLEAAQNELIAANKSKSFYISALSHEMGNPLNAISGYNQLLEQGDVSIEQATTVIAKNVHKLSQIITQALDYDNQNNQHKQQSFCVHQLINELFNDFKIQASQKQLSLINKVAQQKIASNQTKWQQVFTNLISNAIKYTESGSITVQSQIKDQQLIIDVIDTGCGMSESFQNRLFKAWSREYRSDAQGNGIGLVISKMLAEQLNAELFLHTSNDQGSCFRFCFPLPNKPQQKILLVDDDEDCLNLFAFYLEKDHHTVVTATSIEQMQSLLIAEAFDLLITDLNLDSGQVTQAIELIKQRVQRTIIITANPSLSTQNNLLKLGFDQVLSKPLSEAVLRNSVTKS